jgi:hypothetical protein
LLNVPTKLTNPASVQASSTNPGDCNSADMGAIFLKIPVPMTALMTKTTAVSRPMERLRETGGAVVSGVINEDLSTKKGASGQQTSLF